MAATAPSAPPSAALKKVNTFAREENMLQIGIVACNYESHEELGSLLVKIKPRPEKIADPRCMREFWANYPSLYCIKLFKIQPWNDGSCSSNEISL